MMQNIKQKGEEPQREKCKREKERTHVKGTFGTNSISWIQGEEGGHFHKKRWWSRNGGRKIDRDWICLDAALSN